jgi:hypothetical protein
MATRRSPSRDSLALARTIVLALTVPGLVALAANGAVAQTRKAAPTQPTRAPARPPASRGAFAASDGGSRTPSPSPVAPISGAANADSGVLEAKTLDGGTQVFKFSELDIEGRLKSPQLVYFLRRVRAEFAAGDLGHRSFMREMSETRRENF